MNNLCIRLSTTLTLRILTTKPYLNKQQHFFKITNSVRTFYDVNNRNSTIYSLSSSIRESTGSPIGIVRVSGNQTSRVLELVTKKQPLRQQEIISKNVIFNTKQYIRPRMATLCKIYAHHDVPDDIIDNGLVLWFPKSNSFTGEDVCEFHLHGSQSIISSLLSTLATIEGCRPAEPGEFTRRSFENKKIDLTMAEGMADLISSKTDQQRKMALMALNGETRDLYKVWSEQLTIILSHLEASIDFGEDELIGEANVVNKCLLDLRDIKKQIEKHVWFNSRRSELVRDGIKLTILGAPNAGKSTFMNLLCQKDLAIVSDISGTTRDVIEHTLQLGGYAIKVCDTAGLKNLLPNHKESVDTCDPIEEAGIKRALNKARTCDMMLYIIDAYTLPNNYYHQVDTISREIETILENIAITDKQDEEEFTYLNQITLKIILNKVDKLNTNLDDNYLSNLSYDIGSRLEKHLIAPSSGFDEKLKIVRPISIDAISCKTQYNLDHFTSNLIESVTTIGKSDNLDDEYRVTYMNERHASHLRAVIDHLDRASVMSLESVDQMAQHARECIDYMSRITGTITNEQVLDIIFRDFCIGK